MSHGSELLTVGDVAEALNVNTSTVRRWADTGRIPSITLPSGIRRFKREVIEEILAGGAVAAAEAAARPVKSAPTKKTNADRRTGRRPHTQPRSGERNGQ